MMEKRETKKLPKTVTNSGVKINPVNSKPAGSKETKKVTVKLPQTALNTTNMLFLVTREFKRHKRYKTPFSTIIASIKHIILDGKTRKPTAEETAELLPQFFRIIQPLLRDVDLAGTIIPPDLFLALPMTDELGVRTVKVRILEKVDRNVFTLAGQEINMSVKITIAIPTEEIQDIRSYLKYAMKAHYA